MPATTLPFRRPAAALFVVLLHLGVIAMVVQDFSADRPRGAVPRETILELLRVAPPLPTAAKKLRTHRLVPERLLFSRSFALPEKAPEATRNDAAAQALHALLFDCSPDAMATASPEQRRHCLSLDQMPGETAQPLTLPSRTHDLPHWQRALARKQSPPLLPCASPDGAGLSIGTLACVGQGLSGGFGDLDERPGYGDVRPDDVVIPNNGAPRVPDPMPH